MTFDMKSLRAALAEMPTYTPDPIWKAAAKERLLRRMDSQAKLGARQWALLASDDPFVAAQFADAVSLVDGGWRPVVVNPTRLNAAVSAIRPGLVMLQQPRDKRRLPRMAPSTVVMNAARMDQLSSTIRAWH